MERQRVGVIGLGPIGNRHADCHMQDPLSELVAVFAFDDCDVTFHKRHDVQAFRMRPVAEIAGVLVSVELCPAVIETTMLKVERVPIG